MYVKYKDKMAVVKEPDGFVPDFYQDYKNRRETLLVIETIATKELQYILSPDLQFFLHDDTTQIVGAINTWVYQEQIL